MFNFNHWLNRFPGTNFHELNIDWLVEAVKDIAKELQHFELVNQISYQGIWDITKQYPAWSIVTDNNDGYVSLQPVPVGINITNSDYWTKISNFSQELANLGNRVIALEQDVDDIQDDITYLKGLIDNSTRKIMCISDSYGLTPNTSESWIPNLQRCLGISNANFYRSQANGAGFIGVYPNVTFVKQIQALANNMTSDEKNKITDIVIAGGFNDAGHLNVDFTESDLRDAIDECISYINSTFPNAHTYLVYLGWSVNSFAIHSTIRRVMNIYTQEALHIGERISVIDDINWMHRIALVDGTGYHPNGICGGAIGQSIASVLNGGTSGCDLAPHTDGYIPFTISAIAANVSGLSSEDLRQTYRDGVVYTSWKNIQFTNLSELGATGELAIGTITDGCTVGGAGFSDACIMPCWFVVSGTCYAGSLLIHEGKLHLGNNSGVAIPANSSIVIGYGYGACDVMI